MVVLAIFWLLFFAAAVSGIRWTLYLFFASLAFGSLAILPVNLTGGTTFLPHTACSALLCIRSFIACRKPHLLIDGLLDYNKLGLLTAFIVYGLMVTYTAPFLFHGAPIMGLNNITRSPLGFGSGNITQPLYLLAAFAITISIYQLLLQTDTRRMVYQAIFVGGAMALIAGMIDMATAGSGMLAPLRTATYVIMDGDDVGGMRRVIGFNTEASAYGALVLSFGAIIYFTRIGEALGGIYAKIQTPMALALIAFTVLSTSSAAFLGLGILGVFAVVANVMALRHPADEKRALIQLLVIGAAGLIVAALVVATPSMFNGAVELVDSLIFKKTSSSSYSERSSWNLVSLEGLVATGGYGVGVGSTRASSWPVAVLSSTGVIGGLLMALFFLRLLTLGLRNASDEIRRVVIGARYSLAVCLVPSAVAGTLVDFGAFNATLFAITTALPTLIPVATRRRRVPRAPRVQANAVAQR
ncbi:hypothetical protein [Sphingomonas sp. 2SG]|uniref:hypothetical protein n=1 Tax=Sphingomonas sp. 2SG TaxID=2502201 RepID=UPI0010F51F94|nr:hypothetical protein [Sphingomonas sp. 2SG]